MIAAELENIHTVCEKCHKKLNLLNNYRSCNSCLMKFHNACAKSTIVAHCNVFYCTSCLRPKDILRYNPYLDVINNDKDDDEKIYLQNIDSPDTAEILSFCSDVMENCTIDTIKKFSELNIPKHATTYKFLNIDGNASDFDTFSVTLAAITHKFSVIGLSETNVNCLQKETYKLEGYNSVYNDNLPGKKKGSGIALYIKNTFSFIKLQQYCNVSEDIESLFLEISNQQYTATVGVIYRPPNGNISNFLKYIAGILETASSNKQDTVIMDDFNINMFHENRSSSCFEEVILCNGLTPTASVVTHAKPNCSLSCIDNIIVNNP